MAKHPNRTTDTHTTRKVTGSHSREADDNTANAPDTGDGAPAPTNPDAVVGPQTVDPLFAGQKGEFDGALAIDEKDVQTESQANAKLATTGERPGRGEPQEFVETGPGRVQSTKPQNDPA